MNELQKHDFKILKYIDDFCKEHKIKYSLYSGTLLGSIRHKGFIPWDDDLDIMMTREEFDKFEVLFMQSNYTKDGYYYHTNKILPYLASPISRVRDKSYNIVERVPKTQEGYEGAWVDIFPFDNIPNDEKSRKEQFKKVNYYNNLIKFFLLIQVEPNDRGIKRIIKYIVQLFNETFYKLYFFLPYLIKKRHKYMTMYNNEETTHKADLGYMFHKSYNEYTKKILRKESFEKYMQGDFEGEKFPIPNNYDEILKTTFGNYFEIPKEEDRKTHKIELLPK